MLRPSFQAGRLVYNHSWKHGLWSCMITGQSPRHGMSTVYKNINFKLFNKIIFKFY